MAKQTVFLGTSSNDGTGDKLRVAMDKIQDNTDEIYTLLGDGTNLSITGDISVSGGAVTIANDSIDHDELATRYTVTQTISTLTGSVTFNCANGSVFKLSGDLTGAYTINLSNYKLGQIITIYGLRGNQTLNLGGQGSSTNTFNKIGADYEDNGTDYNIIQIECVDDSATDPVFFYSISTYSSDSTDI